jgi:hypothetical protein
MEQVLARESTNALACDITLQAHTAASLVVFSTCCHRTTGERTAAARVSVLVARQPPARSDPLELLG